MSSQKVMNFSQKTVVDTRIGKCCKCGKDASWNTPCVNPQNNELFCDSCSHESTVLLRGIVQHLDKNGNYVQHPLKPYVKNHCIVFASDLEHGFLSAWTHDGHRSFPVSSSEINLLQATEIPFETRIEAFLDKMASIVSSGKTRCTRCHRDLDESEIAGRPLFTGVNCDSCFEVHKNELEEQRKNGHVCRMCGQPYGNCSC